MKVKYESDRIIIEPENAIDEAYLNQFQKPGVEIEAQKDEDSGLLDIRAIMVVR